MQKKTWRLPEILKAMHTANRSLLSMGLLVDQMDGLNSIKTRRSDEEPTRTLIVTLTWQTRPVRFVASIKPRSRWSRKSAKNSRPRYDHHSPRAVVRIDYVFRTLGETSSAAARIRMHTYRSGKQRNVAKVVPKLVSSGENNKCSPWLCHFGPLHHHIAVLSAI